MNDTLETVLEQARVTPAEALPEFLGRLETARVIALSRLQQPIVAPRRVDELLGISEAARRLGVSRDYLYRHHAQYTFTRRVGRRLLFSSAAIEQFIAEQK